MRKAPDITIKKNRLAPIDIILPVEGEIVDLGVGVFQVHDLKLKKVDGFNEAEFVLDTMDGEITVFMRICSIKPFRKK